MSSLSESRRIDAARQLIELRAADAAGANGLLDLITPTTSTELAAGLVDAVATSKAPQVGQAFVAVLPRLSPGVRSRVLRVLLGPLRLGSGLRRVARARPGPALRAGS